jgi:hypothetical protein
MTIQRNLTILVAILVSVPIAYGFRAVVGGADFGGSFLLLMTLAVGVPTAYDEFWPKYDRTWDAIIWVVAACIVATTEFTGLYLMGTGLGNLSPFLGSTVPPYPPREYSVALSSEPSAQFRRVASGRGDFH